MKNTKHILSVTYGAPVAYANFAIPQLPAAQPAKVAELKSCLVQKLSAEYAEVGSRLVYQAVNEAGALAALTGLPLLVLPSLAEEKVQSAAAWSARQQSLLREHPLELAA